MKSLINSMKTYNLTLTSMHPPIKSKRKIEKAAAHGKEKLRLAPHQTKAAKQLNRKFKRMLPELPLRESDKSLPRHSLPNARAQRLALLRVRNLNNRLV